MSKDEDEEWLINIEYAIWLADSIGELLKKEKKEKILKEVTQGKNSIDVELKFIWNANNFYDFNENFFRLIFENFEPIAVHKVCTN